MDIIAYRLRALRRRDNLSQETVAHYLGISRTAYNKYESGAIKPVRKICELAELFHVSTDYLLGLEESSLESQIRYINSQTAQQVQKYLSLSDRGKEIVDVTLNAVYTKETAEWIIEGEG